MSRSRLVALVVTTLALVPAVALAGYAVQSEVYISPVSNGYRLAEGDVHDARHSADSLQYIDCYTRANSATYSQGVCYARTSEGTFMMCTTSAENAMSVIRSINTGSHIMFRVAEGGYTCDMMTAMNGSRFMD